MLINLSCNDNCKIDKEFKNEFDHCILQVELLNKEGNSSDINLRVYTYECLYAITGFEGHVDKDNEPHYFYPYSDTIEYVEYDIQEWKKWYEINKCIITKMKADSLIILHGIKIGFPNLIWPPKFR
jgi:hypothetical protein